MSTEFKTSKRQRLVTELSPDFCTITLTMFEIKETYKIETSNETTPRRKRIEISKELFSSSAKEAHKWTLKSISVEELRDIRNREIPSLVIKKAGMLYYTQLNEKTKLKFAFESINGIQHMCSADCNGFNGNSENGLCEKVMSQYCDGIERYDFITEGYELFHKKKVPSALIVVECSNYSLSETSRMRKMDNSN